ncbi:hypothetical protein Gasu2_60930 [Galdieria sulphuraria]|nr:hypothetical protein Gasu2_60930 [Galdieria sulphuraria]
MSVWLERVVKTPNGTHLCEGDGIIPVPCATLKDAWNIVLDGVWHSPRSPGGLWYGHPTIVSQWQHCLQTPSHHHQQYKTNKTHRNE